VAGSRSSNAFFSLRSGGSGLDAYAQKIVEAHAADRWQSEPGKGTKFINFTAHFMAKKFGEALRPALDGSSQLEETRPSHPVELGRCFDRHAGVLALLASAMVVARKMWCRKLFELSYCTTIARTIRSLAVPCGTQRAS